jgi:hypothetical protein
VPVRVPAARAQVKLDIAAEPPAIWLHQHRIAEVWSGRTARPGNRTVTQSPVAVCNQRPAKAPPPGAPRAPPHEHRLTSTASRCPVCRTYRPRPGSPACPLVQMLYKKIWLAARASRCRAHSSTALFGCVHYQGPL